MCADACFSGPTLAASVSAQSPTTVPISALSEAPKNPEEKCPPAPPSTAVFVFYNCRNYRLQQTEDLASPSKPEAERLLVGRILADLAPDLLGLAEIADTQSLGDLQLQLAAHGVELPHAVLLEGPDASRRLALLSRWPVVSDDSRSHLPFELAGRPQWVQRGLLDVTIDLPSNGGPLRLVGLHLKSQRDTSAFDQEALRTREAREIRRHLDAILLEAPDTALLLWGDFNMPRNAPAWGLLAGAAGSPGRLHPVPLQDAHGARWTHHWAEADIYSRIDFILASRAVNRLVDLERSGLAHPPEWDQASDHRPLFLTLQW